MLTLKPTHTHTNISVVSGIILIAVVIIVFTGLGVSTNSLFNQSQSPTNPNHEIGSRLAQQVKPLLEQSNSDKRLDELLQSVRRDNSSIQSIAVRLNSGELIAYSGQHQKLWETKSTESLHITQDKIPVFIDDQLLANLEISFKQQDDAASSTWWSTLSSSLQLMLGSSVLLFGYLAIYKGIHFLRPDPASIFQGKVGIALDTLTEAVIILDTKGKIILINDALRALHPQASNIEAGQTIDSLPWLNKNFDENNPAPWNTVLTNHEPVTQQIITIPQGVESFRVVMMNISPIPGDSGKDSGKLLGCMLTLQDITEQERTNNELRSKTEELKASKTKIELQNKELYRLANTDQLTGILNRRALFDNANLIIEQFHAKNAPLACVMCDIDHFKSVNDNYGHSVGDEVIKVVASLLKNTVRPNDLVGRYGGEEFCLILPGVSEKIAEQVCDRVRIRIEKLAGKGVRSRKNLKVTSSFGLAMLSKDDTLSSLIEHADSALYLSKQNGRNCVTTFSDQNSNHLKMETPRKAVG